MEEHKPYQNADLDEHNTYSSREFASYEKVPEPAPSNSAAVLSNQLKQGSRITTMNKAQIHDCEQELFNNVDINFLF